MSKYETSNNPAVIELRTMLYDHCVEAIQLDLVDSVLKNATKFLNDNASDLMAAKLTALTFNSMGVVMSRMKSHCGQKVGAWVSQDENGAYRLEAYCECCGWIQKYGGNPKEEDVTE